MTIVERLVALLIALCAAFGGGCLVGVRHEKSRTARDALQASEAAREVERTKAQAAQRITDDLSNKARASESARRAVDRRLRDLAARDLSTHPEPACRSDAPPAARLSEETRSDLVQLAADANDTANRLEACQRLLREK